MKKRIFLLHLFLIFAAEITALIFWSAKNIDHTQDTVLVNEAVQSVLTDWNDIENHKNETGLDYVILDMDGTILFRTKSGLSETINAAISHRDTILTIYIDGLAAGSMIIYNHMELLFQSWKQSIVITILLALLMQCGICTAYILYLNHAIIKPFSKLKGFAERIAGGCLEVPLLMDRQNLFGAFTESFDIMRSELKKAKAAEAEANAGKKELIANLSHDIKTPVASIKAAAEVGAALAEHEKMKQNYMQIIQKADQINTLITNLFTAALEELKQLSVAPQDIDSKELKNLLENSDYLHRAVIPAMPGCILYADKLRLQQVFDNIFANAYKYADTTPIFISAALENNRFFVTIEDSGGGVSEKDLALIKEKFRRGSNTGNIEGAGLGLYLSDYFMKEMHGDLFVENGQNGLKVCIIISLSGTI